MKSNIATVFGVQSVSSIIPFTISFEFDSKPITVTGFISKPVLVKEDRLQTDSFIISTLGLVFYHNFQRH